MNKENRVEALSARVAKKCLSEDANMAYDTKIRRVRSLLRDLDKQLSKHEIRQGDHSADWGFVGDLGYVEEQLTEVLRFVSGGTRK